MDLLACRRRRSARTREGSELRLQLPHPSQKADDLKRFTTAGDIAIPVAMAKGPKTKTTVKYAICCSAL